MVRISVENSGKAINPLNPAPFQNHLASPSGIIQFWLSPDGIKLARTSNHPNVRAMLEQLGVDLGAPVLRSTAPKVKAFAPPQQARRFFAPCNYKTGTKFNLEPISGMPDIGIPTPQNEESVDFIPNGGRGGADLVISGANDLRGAMESNASNAGNGTPNPFSWGLSNTGYYVARDGGCGPSFEGGLPHIRGGRGGNLFGLGDPVISVDATRGNVYAADLRENGQVTAVGLFRTTAGILNSESACPSGTHVGDASGNDTTASTCWPVSILVGGSNPFLSMVDKPHIKADERQQGTGAGDIYVSWTHFGFDELASSIGLSACKSDFTSSADCSDPIFISGVDFQTQFSHMVVRPDGILSITYVNTDGFFDPNTGYFLQTKTIRYVTCQPQGAPNPPVCSDPTTVGTETQPIFSHLASNAFRVATYPVHDVRIRQGQVEEIIAWARCHENTFVPIGVGFGELFSCPKAEVVYTSSLTDSTGAAFHWSDPVVIDSTGGDQFFPWVAADRSTGAVSIQYYSSENDEFHHRLQVMVSTLKPNEDEIEHSQVFISALNEPDIDVVAGPLFYGDYLGLVSRSGWSYSASTFSNFGIYGGNSVLGQDNVLTGFRTLNQGQGGGK